MTRGQYIYSPGFTLIELSMVLVIIGLIVGGVLVGQDLIRAAAVRATITQIEKYNTAVNTFRGKYNALPGDIPAAQVTSFGFTSAPTRAGTQGRGDGNGLIEGMCYPCGTANGTSGYGEAFFFWEDLSANSHLIEDNFNTAQDTTDGNLAVTQLPLYVPLAKLGNGNYIYAYSDNGSNYFGMSYLCSISYQGNIVNFATCNSNAAQTGTTVMQAYLIDGKIDDGMPMTGAVQASYVEANHVFPSPNSYVEDARDGCYNNATNRYAISYNDGSGMFCGLSFQFQ